jgi:hypothetical protein
MKNNLASLKLNILVQRELRKLFSGLYYKNILTIRSEACNVSLALALAGVVSDAPKCGITYDRHLFTGKIIAKGSSRFI